MDTRLIGNRNLAALRRTGPRADVCFFGAAEKSFGLPIPMALLSFADEVIE